MLGKKTIKIRMKYNGNIVEYPEEKANRLVDNGTAEYVMTPKQERIEQEVRNLKENAVNNLRDIKEILDELKVNFWLDCGTLLGAYRDGDFCAGDENDIDLSCWFTQNNKREKIIEKAKERGFKLYYEWALEISLERGGSKVDLFFNRKKGNDVYTHLYNNKRLSKWVVSPKRLYTKFDKITFYDMEFNAPSPIEEYLELRYGDWLIPVSSDKYSCFDLEQNKLARDYYVE